MSRLDALLDGARADAAALRPLRVAFITCSYDTAFEPIADQVDDKIAELQTAFSHLDWSLWVVDDTTGPSFAVGTRAAFARHAHAALHLLPLRGGVATSDGLKGRALLDGMASALEAGADAVVYINLNLKVPAVFAAPGLRLLQSGVDAAIGTRAPEHGGVVHGAGKLGRIKSRAYARLATVLLPPLAPFADTNAPMKVFNAGAAAHLVRHARLDHVTLDCEWLMLMHAAGVRMEQFPVAWIQREGSRPPWHLVALSLRDAARVRRRWQAGELPDRVAPIRSAGQFGNSPTNTW